MKIRGLKDEDFVNYKLPSMFIAFPECSFKCGVENCQNQKLYESDIIEISCINIANRYIQNDITKAIVIGGLEPFDSYDDLLDLIRTLRQFTDDTIIIYSGYEQNEIIDKVNKIATFKHIIIKFGRYIPNQPNKYNELLGVTLASSNQYAIKF